MGKYVLLVSIMLFGSIPESSYAEQYNFQKRGISYVWEKEPHRSESKKVFLNAFVKCYDRISLDLLKQPSRKAMIQWLNGAFKETYVDFKNSKNILWISAKVNNKTVGFLVIDVEKHPEEIYLSQLSIDPAHQGKGIATSLIRSLFDQFPECHKFVAITRIVNEEAKGLYHSLGFSPGSYMREGYSPELYTGFEYTN